MSTEERTRMKMGHVVLSRLVALWSVTASVTCVVGMVTVGWLQAPSLDSHVGMWSECVTGQCVSLLRLDVGDWLITCQGLSVTALLSSLLTLGLAAFLAKGALKATPTAIYGIIATSLFTGVVTVALSVSFYLLFPLRYPRHAYTPSFSFFLTLAAGCMYLVLAVTLILFCVILRCRHNAPSTS